MYPPQTLLNSLAIPARPQAPPEPTLHRKHTRVPSNRIPSKAVARADRNDGRPPTLHPLQTTLYGPPSFPPFAAAATDSTMRLRHGGRRQLLRLQGGFTAAAAAPAREPATEPSAAQTRQTATSPRESPDTSVCLGPAASVRTGAWWQNSGGAASARRPADDMPAHQRRISCIHDGMQNQGESCTQHPLPER